MRFFAARLQSLPKVGTVFKHRDLDLFLRIVRIEPFRFKPGVVVEYGTVDNGEFTPLNGRHRRVLSRFSIHLRYDEV